MIVFDANVLIGFLDSADAHHDAAVALLEDHADDEFGASVVTVAEALVHPARRGAAEDIAAHLARIGLEILPVDAADAVPLARLRAEFALRMPDAVVLHAAMSRSTRMATFDTALAVAAEGAGIEVVSSAGPVS